MQEFQALIRLLEQELIVQERLLQLLSQERVAIVNLNQEQIEALREEKNQVLARAKAIETERGLVVGSILGAESPTSAVKLSDLFEQSPSPEARESLEKVGKELKLTALSACDMSKHNEKLIKQSLGLVLSTVALFRSNINSDFPVYSEQEHLLVKKDLPQADSSWKM